MSVQIRNRIKALEYIDSADLTPHPGNWRDHPKAQADALLGVLKEVGIAGALLAYRSERQGGALVVIDGHLRKDAAPTKWPVLVLDVDDAEADYLLATHDPLAAMATADAGALDALLSSVQSGEAAVQGMLAKLAESAGIYPPKDDSDAEPQIDRAEELREQWGVELGQMWRLPSRTAGQEHRLVCGDCLNLDVIGQLLLDDVPSLVIADPPYGLEIVTANGYVGGGEAYNIPFGGVKNKRLGSVGGAKPFGSKAVRGSIGAANVVDVGKYAPIVGDDTTETALKASGLFLSEYPGAIQVWWGGNHYADKLPASSGWLVWDKEATGNFSDCELAWTNQPRAARLFRHKWNGMLRDSERERRWHPSQKPAALASWAYSLYEGANIILDPFSGAGWSIIAAENLSRQCRAVEISPAYVAVALQRYADAFGIEPELITDGD